MARGDTGRYGSDYMNKLGAQNIRIEILCLFVREIVDRESFSIQSGSYFEACSTRTLMALSLELRNFCESWREKSAAYSLDDLGGAFDRFFTSYVVFNRLYVETTHRLARRGAVGFAR